MQAGLMSIFECFTNSCGSMVTDVVETSFLPFAVQLYSRFFDKYGWTRNCGLCPINIYLSLTMLLPTDNAASRISLKYALRLPSTVPDEDLYEHLKALQEDQKKMKPLRQVHFMYVQPSLDEKENMNMVNGEYEEVLFFSSLI